MDSARLFSGLIRRGELICTEAGSRQAINTAGIFRLLIGLDASGPFFARPVSEHVPLRDKLHQRYPKATGGLYPVDPEMEQLSNALVISSPMSPRDCFLRPAL